MSFLSIDIGTNSAAVVQGTVSGGTVSIEAAGRIPLKAGTIIDSSIRNQTELISSVSNLIQRKSLKAKKAIVTINAANALIREFSLPDGKLRQLESMVRSEMINTYSALASDVIEFKKLGDDISESGGKLIRVRAMALNNDMVDSYRSFLVSCKLKPHALDFYANSVEKLLATRPALNGQDLSGRSFILLDFAYAGVMAYIVYDYVVYAARFIPIGLADLETVILSYRYDLQNEDGAPLDFAQLLDFRADSTINASLLRSAGDVLTQCCNEIQKLIIYSTARLPQNVISAAFLAGEGSEIPAVDSVFSRELNTSVQPLAGFSNVRFLNKDDEKDIRKYLNSIGALIRL